MAVSRLLRRSRVCEADEIADLVFREFGVVHVLFGGERIV